MVLSAWNFLALAITAFLCIVGLTARSGFISLFFDDEHYTRLPGLKPDRADGGGELRLWYTGVWPIDAHLVHLTRFFWPMVSGQIPSASLFAFWAAGQTLALHAVLMLEGLRAGNKGRFLSRTALIGIVYQNIPYGIIIPLWAILYLQTSPLARLTSNSSPGVAASQLRMDETELSMMPWALAIGYVLPTVLAALPAPTLVTVDRKQILLAIWQGFPLITGAVQSLLVRTIRLFTGARRVSGVFVNRIDSGARLRLRLVYWTLLAVTASTHLATVCFISIPALRPSRFGDVGDDVSFEHVFVPRNVCRSPPEPLIMHGAVPTLQFDVGFAVMSLLLLAHQVFGVAASSNTGRFALLATLLSGPAGAALTLSWRRDEQFLLRSGRKGIIGGKGLKIGL